MALASLAFLAGATWLAIHVFKARQLSVFLTMGPLCVVLAVLGLFFIPEVILLPQDLGVFWFESQLQRGMTRSEIENLRSATFGAAYGYGSRLSGRCTDADSVCAFYTTTEALCIVGGTVFKVTFDEKQQVVSWEKGIWGEGC